MKRTDRLRRLRVMIRLLEEAVSGTSVEDLAAELEVSTRTVHRDLRALRASGYPLSSEGAKWYFVQSLPTSLSINPSDKASERDRLMSLDRSIRQGRLIDLEYTSVGSYGSIHLQVLPQALKYLEGNLFLVARQYPHGPFRTLALERIGSLKSSGKRSQMDEKSPSLSQYLENQFRQDASKELVRVLVQFCPPLSLQIRERIFHPSQRVTLHSDDTTLVAFKVPSFRWMMSWVMGFGSDALVVEPKELVRMIRAELEKTSKNYDHAMERVPQLDLFPDAK